MNIRLAQAQDYAQWLPLWQAYQVFYKTSIAELVTHTTWQRFMTPSEPMYCAVAEHDGALVGIVHYIVHRSCWTQSNSIYLQDLFAAPELRNQGIGRALIEHVYAAAKELGCSDVHWLTHETNATAMKLYDRIAEKSSFVQYKQLIT